MVDQKYENRSAPAALRAEAGASDGVGSVIVGDGAGAGAGAGVGAAGAGDFTGLGDEAVALVRHWLDEGAGGGGGPVVPDRAGANAAREGANLNRAGANAAREGANADHDHASGDGRLARVLRDPDGLAFLAEFTDGVVRPEDNAVAARNLVRLAGSAPEFLPSRLRTAIRLGGSVGEALPWAVVPTSKRVLRRMFGHLILDATPARLGQSIAQLTADGSDLNLDLVGEPVLGEAAAARRLAATCELLARDDVDRVTLKLSSIASNLSLWAFDETVERVAASLVPLYELALPRASGADEQAGGHPAAKSIDLDVEEYREFELTIAVFQNVLSRPQLLGLEAGIVLPTSLPDALAALARLQSWAAARVAAGGAPIRVRLVRGANLAMERVDSVLHGWPLALYGEQSATDENHKRVLEWALTPERTEAVRLSIAGHSLFDIAFAWLLAERRGIVGEGARGAAAAGGAGASANPLAPADAGFPRDVGASGDLTAPAGWGASGGAGASANLTAPAASGSARIEFELPLGVATKQADAVRRHVGRVVLHAPIVHPRAFAFAIRDLVQRLGAEGRRADARNMDLRGADARGAEPSGADARGVDAQGANAGRENGSGENSSGAEARGEHDVAAFDLAGDARGFEWERARFLASLAGLESTWPAREAFAVLDSILDTDEATQDARPPRPHRNQDRTLVTDLVAPDPESFANAPDTDPAVPANREWARHILSRVASSRLGVSTFEHAHLADAAALDRLIASSAAAGARWSAEPAAVRAATLRRAALSLEANRDRLLEVMAAETGMTIAEGDPEVSRAVDFATYYAGLALELERVDGARFVPSGLVVVASSWDSPVSTPAGGVLSALAAGAAVILRPAPEAGRSAAVLAEALWEAGIPRELLVLVDLGYPEEPKELEEPEELGDPEDLADLDEASADARRLIADPRVDRVLLSGSYETAELFRSWRPDLPLFAATTTAATTSTAPTKTAATATSGNNAIVVTPSADLDLAVADIVSSAFGRAGQANSAASLVILVGSVAKSARFTAQLVDAVTSLRVGAPDDPTTEMGPLIRPADGRLLDALTRLGDDDHWLVEPRRLDEAGTLWSPGVRTGVPANPGEYSGPVLGILHAATLGDATALQNATDFGRAAGLHSLDPAEVSQWLAGVEAGNLFVNRGITGAVVGRQPVGGWKRSSVGPGAKSGGPNALLHLGEWVTDPGAESTEISLAGLDAKVSELLESATPGLDWRQFDLVRRAALSDEEAWNSVFAASDLAGLGAERNVLRYRSVPVVVRLSEGEPLEKLVRVLAAGTRARASLGVSSALKLPRPLRALLKERRVRVFVEDDAAWFERAAKVGAGSSRIRMIGGDVRALATAIGGSPDVAIYAGEVTRAGRIELLPFVREQMVSVTNHRFGGASGLAGVEIR